MRRSRLAHPLRKPQFRRLAASYLINELGDWMGIVALSVLVFDRTGSALATAGLFLGTRFLPALLAPIVVTKVEQPPPRFALPVIYCGEAAAFGALALLAGGDFLLAGVIVLSAVDGTLALTGSSLTRAVVAAQLEPGDELRAGNALLNIGLTICAAAGPALAGIIVAGFGVQTALLLDAVSFYAIAWLLLTAGPLPRAKPEEGHTRDRIRAGIAYLREQRDLRRLLIAQGAAFVFFAAVIPIEVVYAKETLGTGDSGYGIMLASWGGGMVLGSLIFASVRKVALPVLLFFSTLAVGLGYLGLAAAPTLAAACGASIVGGAGNGVQWVLGDQRRAGADRGKDAGAGNERALVDRRGDAGGRLWARCRHHRLPQSPRDLSRRRPRRSRHRPHSRPRPGHKLAPKQGKNGSRCP